MGGTTTHPQVTTAPAGRSIMRYIKRSTILAIAAATALTVGLTPGAAAAEGDDCDDTTTTTTTVTTVATTVPEPVITPAPVTPPAAVEPSVPIAPVIVAAATVTPAAAPSVPAAPEPSVLAVQASAGPVLPTTGTDAGATAALAATMVAAGAAMLTIRRRQA